MNYIVGEAPKTNGRPHPDRDEWLDYPWPGSRLTEEHRQKLCIMSNATKKPMTQLVAESVELMYELFRAEE